MAGLPKVVSRMWEVMGQRFGGEVIFLCVCVCVDGGERWAVRLARRVVAGVVEEAEGGLDMHSS